MLSIYYYRVCIYIVVNYMFYLKFYCLYVYGVCMHVRWWNWKSRYTTWHGCHKNKALTYLLTLQIIWRKITYNNIKSRLGKQHYIILHSLSNKTINVNGLASYWLFYRVSIQKETSTVSIIIVTIVSSL